MPSAVTLTDQAVRVATEIGERLADPARVAAFGRALDEPGATDPIWLPTGLGDGHPGVSLLLAELGRTAPAWRPRAHAHLAAALEAGLARAPLALHAGIVAVAFAAHVASTSFGGYTTLLAQLDQQISALTRQRCQEIRAAATGPVGSTETYDLLSGVTGVGRYLLARHDATGDPATGAAAADVLDLLATIALADDVTIEGITVPRWWATDAGHLNLGLAHGICGPLALLALDGRHAEAIERIVALLHRWRGDGPSWPHWVTLDHYRDPNHPPPAGRGVWCYGTAGIARALHLAGTALHRPDWLADARATLDSALATASDDQIADHALCHGWSGLLQVTLRMARDTADPAYHTAADTLAAKVLAGFDPAARFGYRYDQPWVPSTLDRSGFLQGAAGIGLALCSYANGPSTWDSALLLS
jgi:lantibiotic modifying enzyme